jgi:hypothetical protein
VRKNIPASPVVDRETRMREALKMIADVARDSIRHSAIAVAGRSVKETHVELMLTGPNFDFASVRRTHAYQQA